ncbi:unnamed protein product [Rhizoctonia solani]|uniref:Uncharacterized protein n=1 Tax=Rhizoctonia solani TaxID=456999 RepID=A0A8H3DHK6_9AGAM|nr:unnamed protein product [Rhizoctonia solani]
MTTNEPHPQVTSSIGTTFLIDLGPLRRLVVLSYSRPIQIYGRMLSLVFRPEPNHPEQELLIVVFDWVAGVEVGRFDLPSHTRYSIAFISEEYFIIPQGYKCTGQHDSDQQGKINLFYSPFNKEVQHRQAKHIATFGFPHLHKNQTELFLYVHVVPALVPDTPYWATRVKPVPRIYEQNSRNHLCFSYEAFDNQGYLQSGFQSQLRFGNELGTNGLLFIPPQVLLSLLDQHRRTSSGSSDQLIFIPWESWRSYTVCLADTEIPSASIWGHKYLFLHQGPDLRSQEESKGQINVWELEFRQRPPQKATPGTGGKWSNVSTFGQDATSNGVLSTYILQLPHPTQQEVSDLGAFGAAIPDMHVYCKQTTVDLDDKPNNILGAYDLEIDDEQCGLMSVLKSTVLLTYQSGLFIPPQS